MSKSNKEKIMLGDIIYQRRKELGISQKELAEKLNISNKAVSKWETYEANPDISLLLSLSSILEISVEELLSGKITSKKEEIKEETSNIAKPKRINLIILYILAFLFLIITIFFSISTILAFDISNFDDFESQIIVISFSLILVLVFGYITAIYIRKITVIYKLTNEYIQKEALVNGYRLYSSLDIEEKKYLKKKYIKYQKNNLILAAISLLLLLIIISLSIYLNQVITGGGKVFNIRMIIVILFFVYVPLYIILINMIISKKYNFCKENNIYINNRQINKKN